jgi:hypothetical protein
MSTQENLQGSTQQERAAEELYSMPYDGMSPSELARVRSMAFRRGEAWKIEEIGIEAGNRYDELVRAIEKLKDQQLTYINLAGDCSANLKQLDKHNRR